MQQVILMTGCSSGFGMYTAVQLAKEHRVYASMRDLTKQDTLMSIASMQGVSLQTIQLDVTRPETIQTAVASLLEKHGKIDVLINNAGIFEMAPAEYTTDNATRVLFETNMLGLHRVTQAVIPIMRKAKNGKIINISSLLGLMGLPLYALYSASKWAVEGYSEALRLELAPFNIHVLLVEPALFATRLLDETFQQLATQEKAFHDADYQKIWTLNRDYLLHKKLSDPQFVARRINALVKQSSPAFRHPIGFDAAFLSRIKQWLPFRLYEKLFQFAVFCLARS